MNADREGDSIPAGQRLVRVDGDKGLSLGEKLAAQLHRLTYRTIFHRIRLKGRYPLKLIGVPRDPLPGDAQAGHALLSGRMIHAGHGAATQTIRFASTAHPMAWRVHALSFAWLRDLAQVTERPRAARLAEPLVKSFLADFSEFHELAWRGDILGQRLFYWTAYAPLILSSTDHVYRSAVLNAIARSARHLERSFDKIPDGIARIHAIGGVLTAGLLLPGGEARQAKAETAMARALDNFLLPDGGVVSRAPYDMLELLEWLLMLQAVYAVRGQRPAEPIATAIVRLVPALKGATLGDGMLAAMHGGAIGCADRIERAVTLAAIAARPLRNGINSGFQRLQGGKVAVVLDAGPPPAARESATAHAGTLAFEMSDGATRLIVNCGGGRGQPRPLPAELASLLRSTAAHSTLVLDNKNSTRIRDDGALGKGVEEVVIQRDQGKEGSWLDASHDGYVRRHGFQHRRRLFLAEDGRDLRGEDTLQPVRKGARKLLGGSKPVLFDVRFHLGHGVEATPTADGQGALLKLPDGAIWAFKSRGGHFSIDESLWIDPEGRPRTVSQLVISGEAPPGGAAVNWSLKRAGK